MARHKSTSAGQGTLFTSLFEEGFFFRTLGDLVRRSDVALSELVANAWDAGASRVGITIPENVSGELSVEDDGAGLTKEQFHQRWMTLAYNRVKHQGQDVEFPPGRVGRRRAYGRNGQGRHGLLCFGNTYRVETRRGGIACRFDVRVSSGKEPFESVLLGEEESQDHGTRLSVIVKRNLPDANRMREILASRFLHDPNFLIVVNGESLPLSELPGLTEHRILTVADPDSDRQVRLDIFVVQADAGRTKHQTGVAFWIGNRLVGDAGWTVIGTPIVDGRTRAGRSLTFIVRSDDLFDDVLPDWTGFKSSRLTQAVGVTVADAVRDTLRRLFAQRINETTAEALADFKEQIDCLEPGERMEVIEVAEAIATANPLVTNEILSVAIGGIVGAKRRATVEALVARVMELPEADVDGLHRLLDEWNVRDALTVLDEIGRRLKHIEAIEKLMGESSIDELHVIHPMVTHARWLFGPEYESLDYASNVGLRNAVKKLFEKDAPPNAFESPRKRPDLIILPSSTISAVGAEVFDPTSNVARFRRILIIELKKGGFQIGRKEMDQAYGYVEDLLSSGLIDGSPFIHAFVVGHKRDMRTTTPRPFGAHGEQGHVEAVTFSQLVSMANARLFKIRERVNERYPESGVDLLERFRGKPQDAHQLGLEFGIGKCVPAPVSYGVAISAADPVAPVAEPRHSAAEPQHGGVAEPQHSAAEPQHGGVAEPQHSAAEPQHGGVAEPQHGAAEPQHGGVAEPQHGAAEPQHGGVAEPQHGAAEPQHGGVAEPQHGAAEPQHGSVAEPQHGGVAEPQHSAAEV
ncbi:ATP-binding protein [Sorangium sp. So ce1097]|uniref:ATP-binding protein n=1 Tax=Sorangium sp. So ce1097 TaxID=3133330 RepID=UPI003F5F844C